MVVSSAAAKTFRFGLPILAVDWLQLRIRMTSCQMWKLVLTLTGKLSNFKNHIQYLDRNFLRGFVFPCRSKGKLALDKKKRHRFRIGVAHSKSAIISAAFLSIWEGKFPERK